MAIIVIQRKELSVTRSTVNRAQTIDCGSSGSRKEIWTPNSEPCQVAISEPSDFGASVLPLRYAGDSWNVVSLMDLIHTELFVELYINPRNRVWRFDPRSTFNFNCKWPLENNADSLLFKETFFVQVYFNTASQTWLPMYPLKRIRWPKVRLCIAKCSKGWPRKWGNPC